MYNNVHPVNISYRNFRQPKIVEADAQREQQTRGTSDEDMFGGQNRKFPNGRDVTIDYSQNKINIAQIVADFNSTALAINAPKEVMEEVSTYLGLVTRESEKSKPSKEIIFSNLKNAAKVSDKYIANSLNKPSRVVEGWIDALFMQNIDLKSDPAHINPDFKVDLPKNTPSQPEYAHPLTPAPATIAQARAGDIKSEPAPVPIAAPQPSPFSREPAVSLQEAQPAQASVASPVINDQVHKALVDGFKSTSQKSPQETISTAAVEMITENGATSVRIGQTEQDTIPQGTPQARMATIGQGSAKDPELVRAFSLAKKATNPADALKAFEYIIKTADKKGDTKIKAAAHFERGKIYDTNDLIDNALREYNEAASTGDDYNIKAQAHLKMAAIYDDFSKFRPALDHYHRAVVYAGEASNLAGQSKALGGIATMFAERYDKENTYAFNGLTVETALGTKKPKVIGGAHSTAAKNFHYIDENEKSLESYKNAVKAYNSDGESNKQLAQNYFEAAQVMQKLGNNAKAESLLSKALLYQERVRLQSA